MNLPPLSQPITPELRGWIVQQTRAGHGPQAVLQAMKASGWDEAVARKALESTLHTLGASTAAAASDTAAGAADSGPASALVVPQPALEGSPLYLDLGDRRVHVLQSMAHPRVVVFGDVLSVDECEALIEQARPRLARSLTVATRTGAEMLHADRTSDGMFFQRGESELIARIEARLARLVNWPVDSGEGLQILRYSPGAQYKPHYDYFDPAEPGTPTILRRGGQRVATIILYLAEPAQGGGTTFPDVNLEIAPKQGNAVFFSYDRPHPSSRSLHGGAPVIAGEKWIATKWLRERRFD